MTSIREIRPTTLRSEATRAIRDAILNGEIAPGAIYSAPDLARRLHISSTPVREAMLTLASLGIVEAVRNRGYQIKPLARRELAEIVELRLLIEVPIFGRLAGRLDPVASSDLQQLVDAATKAARRRDEQAFTTSDRGYYLRLLDLAGNPSAAEFLTELRDYADLRGLSKLCAGPPAGELAGQLQAILDAIRGRSRKRAERAVSDHIALIECAWGRAPAIRD